VTLLLVLANYSIQKSIATANAAYIIQACESYREANGSYPARLDRLIPRYLRSIPRAKYCFWFGEFQYFPEVHLLCWFDIPPCGRRVYSLERRTWRYLD
jgi:hypothetical protein